MNRNQEILKEIMDPNPLRRGFIWSCQDDVMRLLRGESNEIRQLTCRLAYKIIDLFELEDCEVMPIGLDPVSKEMSWAIVRIMPQNDGSPESPAV
jgi:hypothetical protein